MFIRQLNYLLALDKYRHFGRAAERLNLSSSAVSHGLGRLRRLLNDPLFLKTPRGVVPTARALELAARYFAPGETRRLRALPADAREAAFLRLWCAKEAVLKAHGHGLSFGLQRLAFDATATTPRLLRCDPALGAASDWRLHARDGDGHVAVVARHDGILPA